MARGDLMRMTVKRALGEFEPQFGSEFTGTEFYLFFKNFPTGSGGRRKIYPANANAMVVILKRLSDYTTIVEGSYDPVLFTMNPKEENGSSPHSEQSD